MTFTGLLELMLSIVAPHRDTGKTWAAAWHDIDFYDAVCSVLAVLDPQSGADGSEVEDDGEGDQAESVSGGSSSSDDAYPESMLGDDDGDAEEPPQLAA